MLIRYLEIDEDFDREKAECIQAEEREDYAELIKMLKATGRVLNDDGYSREIKEIAYCPRYNDFVSSVDVYLEVV